MSEVLVRNSTSFPAKSTAKLRELYKQYLAAQSTGSGTEAAWAGILKYYQFLCRAIMTDPTFGIGTRGNSRGILIYHETGLGKTRLAVAVLVALLDSRAVVAMLPHSLKANLRETIKQVLDLLEKHGALAADVARWRVLVETRVSFVSMDAYNSADQMARAGTGAKTVRRGDLTGATGGLDGKILIVDEAHNFFRAIINSSAENANARRIYDMGMSARNLMILLFTGTPAGKDPFEIVPCFNFLAGHAILPVQYEIFYQLYIDKVNHKIKNREKLANRIMGMVSHVAHLKPTVPKASDAPQHGVLRTKGGTVLHWRVYTIDALVSAPIAPEVLKLVRIHRRDTSDPPSLDALRGEFPGREQSILVVTEGQSVAMIGRADVGVLGDVKSGHLSMIHTAEKNRRQGLCGIATEYLMAAAGASSYTLEVESGNEAAVRCYIKLGFAWDDSDEKAAERRMVWRSGSAKVARDIGWFPEQKPMIVKHIEMGADQYRQYLLAREQEELEGKGEGSGGRSTGVMSTPALALPGSEKKAMKSYFVRSRTLSLFAPDKKWASMSIADMPDEAFSEEAGPKLMFTAKQADSSPGPTLIYSQFVERGGLKPCARYLHKLGYRPFVPELPPHPFKRRARQTDAVPLVELPVEFVAEEPKEPNGKDAEVLDEGPEASQEEPEELEEPDEVVRESEDADQEPEADGGAWGGEVIEIHLFTVDGISYYKTSDAQKIAGTPEQIATSSLEWLLDDPSWGEVPSLIARDVLASPLAHREHTRRVDEADLKWPLLVVQKEEQLILADGMHRLLRAVRDKALHIQIQKVENLESLDRITVENSSCPLFGSYIVWDLSRDELLAHSPEVTSEVALLIRGDDAKLPKTLAELLMNIERIVCFSNTESVVALAAGGQETIDIFRISKEHRGRGYGEVAIKEYIKALDHCTAAVSMDSPEELNAFRACGFVSMGRESGTELVKFEIVRGGVENITNYAILEDEGGGERSDTVLNDFVASERDVGGSENVDSILRGFVGSERDVTTGGDSKNVDSILRGFVGFERDVAVGGDERINPLLVIKDYAINGKVFHVVRDDLLVAGTKQRAASLFVKGLLADKPNIKTLLYTAPYNGYGPVAAAHAANELGLKCKLVLALKAFGAERSTSLEDATNSPTVRKATKLGAEITFSPTWADLVIEGKRIAKDDTVFWLPLGFQGAEFVKALAESIKEAAGGLAPPRIWVAGGTGALATALATAFAQAEIHIVPASRDEKVVSKILKVIDDNGLSARVHIAPEAPHVHGTPYPTVSGYDERAWDSAVQDGKSGDYIWNVAGHGLQQKASNDRLAKERISDKAREDDRDPSEDFPYRSAIMPPVGEMFARLQDLAKDPPESWDKADGKLAVVRRTYPEDYDNTDSITDHFVERVRIGCRERGEDSPAAAWAKIREESNLPDGTRERRELVYAKARGCNLFNGALAAYLVGRFGARGRVLDCTSGWGDRLFAAGAGEAIEYRGWDTNPDLQPVYAKIGATIEAAGHKLDWKIELAPFESAAPLFRPGGKYHSYFDMAFLCPPYFDKEVYQGPDTSTEAHQTEERWYSGFYRPAVRAAAGGLRPGGHLLAYVPPGRMQRETAAIMEGLGFEDRGAVGFQQIVVGKRPIDRDTFVWRRRVSDTKVWRKKSHKKRGGDAKPLEPSSDALDSLGAIYAVGFEEGSLTTGDGNYDEIPPKHVTGGAEFSAELISEVLGGAALGGAKLGGAAPKKSLHKIARAHTNLAAASKMEPKDPVAENRGWDDLRQTLRDSALAIIYWPLLDDVSHHMLESEWAAYGLTISLKGALPNKGPRAHTEGRNAIERWIIASVNEAPWMPGPWAVHRCLTSAPEAFAKFAEELTHVGFEGQKVAQQLRALVEDAIKELPPKIHEAEIIVTNDVVYFEVLDANLRERDEAIALDSDSPTGRAFVARLGGTGIAMIVTAVARIMKDAKTKPENNEEYTKAAVRAAIPAAFAVVRVALRYAAAASGGQQLGLPRAHYEALYAAGVRNEGFASPINSRLLPLQKYDTAFCSLFPDTDRLFGSMGRFFDLEVENMVGFPGGWTINPPYIEKIMEATSDKVQKLLALADTTKGDPLQIFYLLPAWDDSKAVRGAVDGPYAAHAELLTKNSYKLEEPGGRIFTAPFACYYIALQSPTATGKARERLADLCRGARVPVEGDEHPRIKKLASTYAIHSRKTVHGGEEVKGYYAIISGEVPADVRDAIRAAEVSPANAHGALVKHILVSKTGVEGLDLKHIRLAICEESYWDRARVDQFSGRASRVGSHDALPRDEREVQVYMLLAVQNRMMLERAVDKEEKTIDVLFHERAEDRYLTNKAVRELLAEVCYECDLFGYGNCRVCVPTGVPLFRGDPSLDARLPDPCTLRSEKKVSAAPLVLGNKTYHYVVDESTPLGYIFYEFRKDLDGHAAVDPSDPVIGELLEAVAAKTGGAQLMAKNGYITPHNMAEEKKTAARTPPIYPDRKFVRPVPPDTIVAKEEDLMDFRGDRLTAAEITAVEAVADRLIPMKDLPVNASEVPRIPYRQHVYRLERYKSARHYGQRKLLASEVDFLLNNAKRGDTVVYAGSAPGIHIPFLASLFRHLDLKYVLIDPRPFELPRGYPEVMGNIETRQGFFTDESVAEFAGRDDVLFVSDIRSGTDEFSVPSDDMVEADMEMQKGWVLAMNPRAILLKYRLNYNKGEDSADYLAGEVRIQVWAPASSTETRLEAQRPYKVVKTDARDHEERMAYINNILREWAAYDHGVPLHMAPGLDLGFDSASEVRIWRRYLELAGGLPPEIKVRKSDKVASKDRDFAKLRRGKSKPDALVAGDAEEIAALINKTSAALRRGLIPSTGPQRHL